MFCRHFVNKIGVHNVVITVSVYLINFMFNVRQHLESILVKYRPLGCKVEEIFYDYSKCKRGYWSYLQSVIYAALYIVNSNINHIYCVQAIHITHLIDQYYPFLLYHKRAKFSPFLQCLQTCQIP